MPVIQKFAMIILLPVLVGCGAIEAGAAGTWMASVGAEFEVTGDLGETELRQVIAEFDALRQEARKLDPKRGFRFPYPVRVVAVRDARSPIFEDAFVDGLLTKTIVFRYGDEAAKQGAYRAYLAELFDNEFGRASLPAWLRTGLIEHFATLRTTADRQPGPPTPNARSLTLENLFEMEHYALNRQTRATAAGFYSRSKLLVDHLLSQGPAKFAALIYGLNRGEPAILALKESYGYTREELAQMLRKPSPSEPFLNPKPTDILVRPVSETETRVIVAEILFGLGRTDAAMAELRGMDPSAIALTINGLSAERAGKRDVANRLFEQAIDLDPNDYRPSYAYASVLIDRETTEYGLSSGFKAATAALVRENLERSIRLAPDFGENYQLLAFVNSVRGEMISDTIDRMKLALAIAPGNAWYQMRMVELLVAQRDFAGARLQALRIKLGAADDRLRVYSENTLTRMASLEQQLASLKDKKPREVDGITDAPMSDEEIARRRERALNESLNLALRIPATDETRVVGTIEKVECAPDAVIVTVNSDNRTLKLKSPSIERITLTSYVDKLVNSEFGCGSERRSGLAVVTFRAAKQGSGELVAIEFVPPSFRFLTKND
jgi:tetratricopeptide (TPR) repeat protein